MEATEESEAYPRPPQYYKLFANSNTALPPPIPPYTKPQTLVNSSFTCFGVKYPLPDSLEDYDIPRLNKDSDPESITSHKKMLLLLLDSLMASTFQLLRFLEVNPEKASDKVADINLIVKNMLFLLNSFRKRQCLYDLLEDINKKKEQRAVIEEDLKRLLVDIKDVLNEISK